MSINFDMQSYRTMFTGGQRAYLFFVLFTFPDATIQTGITTLFEKVTKLISDSASVFGFNKNSRMFPYLVKSTSLPEASFDEVNSTYGGLTYRQPGVKTYGDWNVSLNIDEKGIVLDKFDDWHKRIYSKSIPELPANYMKDQQVFLLDYAGNTIKKYNLHYAWPKTIGNVELSYDSVDIATFDITFSYLNYTVEPADGLVGTIVKKAYEKIISKF